LLPYCQREKIALIAYNPLEKGELARPGHEILDQLAEKYDKTQAQTSLNWLITQDQVVTIPKAEKEEHLKDNIGALGWELEEEDIKQLTEGFGS
jgi:diketogulonate reductase-like aldo/keto reductase